VFSSSWDAIKVMNLGELGFVRRDRWSLIGFKGKLRCWCVLVGKIGGDEEMKQVFEMEMGFAIEAIVEGLEVECVFVL